MTQLEPWAAENAQACFAVAIAAIRERVEAERKPGESTEDASRRLGLLRGYFRRRE